MIETSYKIPITDGFTPAPSVISFQRNILDIHNDIQFPSYRAAFKLNELRERTLLHHLDLHGFAVVWQSFEEEMERLFVLKQLAPSEALLFSSNFAHKQEAELTYNNINLFLKKTYKYIQERSLHDLNTEEARQFLFDFLIYCFDRPVEHTVRANSLQTLLVLLCANKLVDRVRYFSRSLSTPDGRILIDVLPFFLCDLFQILDGLGEGPSFGSSLADIEKFRLQCLGRLALHAKSAQREWMSQNEFLSLLIQEPVPDCLKWMNVWERVDRTKKDRHKSKCAGCHQTPIVGLRFKCANCRNYNLCQRCFMVRKITGSHKTSHTMREKQLKAPKKSLLKNRLLCTTSVDPKAKERLVTENPLPHFKTPVIGPTLARSVTRSQSITPSSSQFSLHSLPSSTLTNTSSRRAIKEFGTNIKYEDYSGNIQTNLDDVMNNSSQEYDVMIPPTINEGDNSSSPPLSPTYASDSSLGGQTGAENAFDAIVKDLESWLEDMSRDESPLYEQPPVNSMRIKKETKIAYIPYSDEHLPKLSDLLIAEPVYVHNANPNIYPRFSPLPRISTSTEGSTGTMSPSQSSTFEDTLTVRSPAPSEEKKPSAQAPSMVRENGKFIIQVSNKQKSSGSSNETPEKLNTLSPSKVYRSISPARLPLTSNSVQKTMLRFHPSSYDVSSTGKGMFRPLPLEGKQNGPDVNIRGKEEVIWSKTPQKMYGVLISNSDGAKGREQIKTEKVQGNIVRIAPMKNHRSKSDAQETPRPLALRLYAYGLEKESPKSRPNSELIRSNSANIHRPTPLPSHSTQLITESPNEQRKSLGYVGSAALKNSQEVRPISNSLSSLTFDPNIPSSVSTDTRVYDFSHLEYKSGHKGSLGNISRSTPAQYAKMRTERSFTDVGRHTLPKRQSELLTNSLNVAQQSSAAVSRGLQDRINSLLTEAKKHHQPESISNVVESPILRRIRELENMRKTEEKIL